MPVDSYGQVDPANLSAALRDDTRDWWEDVLARDPDELEEEGEPAMADPECV